MLVLSGNTFSMNDMYNIRFSVMQIDENSEAYSLLQISYVMV